MSLKGKDLLLLPDLTADEGGPLVEGDERHTDQRGGAAGGSGGPSSR